MSSSRDLFRGTATWVLSAMSLDVDLCNRAGMYGMGVPIARTIVEAHGGRLWADNNPSGGATFNVALPLLSV